MRVERPIARESIRASATWTTAAANKCLHGLRYSAVTAASNTLASVEHTEKRLNHAQKRFTRACESLARVRKRKLPAVQINVATEGGRQLNVAAG